MSSQLQITSFNGTSLINKFPGDDPRYKKKRAKYLPIKYSKAPEPHPDNGIILDVRYTKKPKAIRQKQSYVSLQNPIILEGKHLSMLHNGTVSLTDDALRTVIEHLRRICPNVKIGEDLDDRREISSSHITNSPRFIPEQEVERGFISFLLAIANLPNFVVTF